MGRWGSRAKRLNIAYGNINAFAQAPTQPLTSRGPGRGVGASRVASWHRSSSERNAMKSFRCASRWGTRMLCWHQAGRMMAGKWMKAHYCF